MGGVQEEKTGQFVNLARLLFSLVKFLIKFRKSAGETLCE